MKIAVCVSGYGRTFKYCQPYLKNFFKGFEVDWFVHKWQDDEVVVDFGSNTYYTSEKLPEASTTLERKVVERFQEYCFLRLIPMYWGIAKSISLVPDHYDLVVRMRPDIIPHQLFSEILPYYEDDHINIAYHMHGNVKDWSPPVDKLINQEKLAGYNDLFFYGNMSVMKKMTSIYEWIDDFCKHPNVTHFTATQVLYYFLQNQNILAKRAPLSLYLIGEEHAKKSIENYVEISRFHNRYETDCEYVKSKFPDLYQIYLKLPEYTQDELWFEKCWSERHNDRSIVLGYNI